MYLLNLRTDSWREVQKPVDPTENCRPGAVMRHDQQHAAFCTTVSLRLYARAHYFAHPQLFHFFVNAHWPANTPMGLFKGLLKHVLYRYSAKSVPKQRQIHLWTHSASEHPVSKAKQIINVHIL